MVKDINSRNSANPKQNKWKENQNEVYYNKDSENQTQSVNFIRATEYDTLHTQEQKYK